MNLPEQAMHYRDVAVLAPCLNEAATIANTVANQGEMVRPVIVETVADATGSLYQAPKRTVVRRAVQPAHVGFNPQFRPLTDRARLRTTC